MKAIQLVPPILLALVAIAYLRHSPEYFLLAIPLVSVLSFLFISRAWTRNVVAASFMASLLGSSILLFLGMSDFKPWGVLSFLFFSTGAALSYIDCLGGAPAAAGNPKSSVPAGSGRVKKPTGGGKR